MCFTGRPLAQAANAQDQLGTTGTGYMQKFMGALPGGSGASAGLPAQATAYAPSGGAGDAPMSQASASGPQPSQAATLANSNTPGAAGAQPAGGVQTASAGPANASASPGNVLMPLLANPATRQIGGQLWHSALQQGSGSGIPAR